MNKEYLFTVQWTTSTAHWCLMGVIYICVKGKKLKKKKSTCAFNEKDRRTIVRMNTRMMRERINKAKKSPFVLASRIRLLNPRVQTFHGFTHFYRG